MKQAVGHVVKGGKQSIAPTVSASYDGVQTNTDNANYYSAADLLSADDANSFEVRRTARSRARYEMESDPSAYGMVATVANDIIGREIGFQLIAGGDEDAKFVEDEFKIWMEAVDFNSRMRTLRIAKAVSGEGIALLTHNPHVGTPVELDFRLVECDRLSDPTFSMASDPNNIDGVILDVYGNTSEYWILQNYPGSLQFSGTGNEYATHDPANVIHWYRATRPEQHRGISELTPALPLFSLRRQYLIATVDAAINVAQMNTVIKTNMSAFVEPAQAQSINNPFSIHRNTATMLPFGYDAMQLKAEQPTSSFCEFDDHLLREIARCLLLPRNAATGDSSDYNYASGQLDKQSYWRAIEIDRNDMIRQVLNKVFFRWLSEAVLIEGYLPESFRSIDSSFNVRWDLDGTLHSDPVKNANAEKIELETGAITYQDLYARKGKYWRDKFDERKEAQEYAKAIGLSLGGEAVGGGPETPPEGDGTEVKPKQGLI
jgi:lambda family phage portal protein